MHVGRVRWCVAGADYYKFDDETDGVADGYPRRIAADFGPRAAAAAAAGDHDDSSDAVPDNLDAAWFDSVSSLLYFFKGEWVRVHECYCFRNL